jgi:hypothetical protein
MHTRYFLCWLWGAALASGWWATSIWFIPQPMEQHVEHAGPTLVFFPTILLTVGTVLAAGYALIKAATDGK